MVDSISLLETNGVFLSSIITSLIIVIYYFYEKKSKGMVASIGIILGFGLIPSNRLKYAVIPIFLLFLVISLSRSSWGQIDDLLFTTIIGIFSTLSLYWIMPVIIGKNYTISSLAAIIPIIVFGVLQYSNNNMVLSKKIIISGVPGLLIALIFSNSLGISHIYWGLGMEITGLILITFSKIRRYFYLGLGLIGIGIFMILEDTLGYLTHDVASTSIIIGVTTILITIGYLYFYKPKWRPKT